MQHNEAFNEIIALAEKRQYIKKKYLKLDMLREAFEVLINDSIEEGDDTCTVAFQIIELICPALIKGCDGRTMHQDFDLEVQSILTRYDYPTD